MGYGAKRKTLRKTFTCKHKSSVRLLFYFYHNLSLCFFFSFLFFLFFLNKGRVRSTREGAVKSAASPDIHSRCWLDLVEPGPVVLGAGFSCLFLQVWCLMLIPPHVPWVLSKHAGAGDSAGRPALPPARLPLSLSLPPLVAHPPTLQQQQHQQQASNRSSSPYLSSQLQPCNACPVQNLRSLFPFPFLFHAFPQTSVSVLVWTPLMKGYVHTAAPQALLQAGTGQLLL